MTNTEKTAQSETAVKASIADTERQLKRYGVVVDSKKPFPKELDDFIRNTVKTLRGGPHSPSARTLHEEAPTAQLMNEWQAMERLAPHLGFLSAYEKNGDKYNVTVPEAEFSQAYVTHPKDSTFKLAKPKPDKTMGYMTRALIDTRKRNKPQPAFTAEEETKLLDDPLIPPINRHVFCPWYTIEFKSFEAYAGLKQAKLQASRNGTAACEYMNRLYARTDIKPTAVDTMHWSVTCDTKTIELFVHWRDQTGDGPVQYHMRRICISTLEAFDDDAEENIQVVEIRKRLRNILDYVQGPRLERIKTVLARIPLPKARSGGKSQKSSQYQQSDEGLGSDAPSSQLENRSTKGDPFQDTVAATMSPPNKFAQSLQQSRGTQATRSQSARNGPSNRAQQSRVPPPPKPTPPSGNMTRSGRPVNPPSRYASNGGQV